MSLASRCPYCLTTFRVVADQLKLRDGLVRCGSCKQVFNGIEHLMPETAEPAAPETEASVVSDTSDTSDTPDAASPVLSLIAIEQASALSAAEQEPALPEPTVPNTLPPLDIDFGDDPEANPAPAFEAPTPPLEEIAPMAEPVQTSPEQATSEEAPAQAALQAALQAPPQVAPHAGLPAESESPLSTPAQEASTPPPEQQTSSLPTAADNSKDNAADSDPWPEFSSQAADAAVHMQAALAELGLNAANLSSDEEESSSYSSHDASGKAEAEQETPAFLLQARRQKRWRGVRRAVFFSLYLLLIAGVAGQSLYYWRNDVATALPATAPVLEKICARLHCTMGLPSDIRELSLESNELLATAPDENTYTLSLLLRNRAKTPQAWPHIELTLKNDEEQAIVRRVFAPNDYLPPALRSLKAMPAGSEQPIKLSYALDQVTASGYAVYLFYPK
ncbi:DUF3426 domain-containing protein [Herbaspirillum sp. RTI4]|uniref:DUF3426 domain-containing protein n=1 Tax=Herbaspirillum sp. RTI4 TaxID=3048640 RepID=UPI002AB4B821|nr:DUF3426 domain-containing protein [Herbaspirillum sp. RTI4]MDY7577525.1 DUF3426 domain-containing protein [Herbaspirillum sp. RTI4]MEA9981000.1 DUF3426 domain-containing protein [Herbaspirillum sp. RTI4]